MKLAAAIPIAFTVGIVLTACSGQSATRAGLPAVGSPSAPATPSPTATIEPTFDPLFPFTPAPTPTPRPSPPPSSALFSFSSVNGDYIGQGRSATYSAPADTFSLRGTPGEVTVSVQSGDEDWIVELAAPYGQVLRAGSYPNATRAPFQTGNAAGLSVFGDGRGCNNDMGSFAIQRIGTDAQGYVNLIEATFTQHCERADAPPMQGTIKYVPAPLTA